MTSVGCNDDAALYQPGTALCSVGTVPRALAEVLGLLTGRTLRLQSRGVCLCVVGGEEGMGSKQS